MHGRISFYVLAWYLLWHVLVCIIFICITCIGMYWCVPKDHMCRYWYLLVSIGQVCMKKMVYIVCVGMYKYMFLCIFLYWPVLDLWCVLVFMVCTSLYLYVSVSNDMYCKYWWALLCMCLYFVCIYKYLPVLVSISMYCMYCMYLNVFTSIGKMVVLDL